MSAGCFSAFLGTARRVVGSGNIWTDCYRWAGRWLQDCGCWSPTNHRSLQTTHSVSGLETGDCPRTQETVYSLLRTYDVDYNNAMQDYWRIYTVEPSTCQSYRIYVSAFCMNAANDDVHVCPVTTDD